MAGVHVDSTVLNLESTWSPESVEAAPLYMPGTAPGGAVGKLPGVGVWMYAKMHRIEAVLRTRMGITTISDRQRTG